jgi:hypothetical protein
VVPDGFAAHTGHMKTLIRSGWNEPTQDGANDERKPVLEAR